MQNYMIGEGWQALSQISSFMQHVEKRKQLKIFGELDARLDYCEYLIRTQTNKNDSQRFKSKKRKKELNQDLCRALKTLATPQIIHYYTKLVTQLVNLTHDVCQPPVIENKSFIICEAYSKTYNLKFWKKKKLRFDRENHIIYAEKDKKIKIYDLANYIIRRSQNSDYFVLILEAINDSPLEKSRTASFGFQYKNTYILWATSVLISIQYKQWESLVVSLGKEHLLNKAKPNYHTIGKDKDQERLNKTEGNDIGSQEFQGQNVQSAVYIPLVEELSSTVEPTAKSEQYEQKSENIQTSQFKTQRELSEVYKLLQESFTYKLTHSCEDIANFQDLHYELQLQGEQTKKIKRQLSFASAILDDFDINKQNLQDLTNFQEIENSFTSIEKVQGETYLYQDRYCKYHYRMIYLSPAHNSEQRSIQILLQYFLNTFLYGKISKSISICQLKGTIYCQNSIINYEQHYPYNRLHRPRDFAYVRHLTHNTIGQTFVIDRSIAGSHLIPQSKFNVRGALKNIYRVSVNKNQIMFIADLHIDHKGELNESRNGNLCKKYIANLVLGLSQFFSVKQEPIASMKYFSLQANNKHLSSLDNVQNEKQQILTFSYSMQTQEKQSFNAKRNSTKKRKKSSFYQIQRANLIQNHQLSQSYLLSQKTESFVDVPQFRKTYSSPRKTYIQTTVSQTSNIKAVHQQVQSNMIIQPLWKLQWKIDQENGGFVSKREITMKKKELLKRVIEKAAKKTLLGKDVEKISFPVDVLAPESRLERLLKNCSYAPGIFEDTHNMSFLKLFKKTVVFGILSAILSLNHQKTFDSELGETYQCQISKDCMGYAEQVGVSPAVSAIYLLGKDYQIQSLLKQKFKLTMSQVQWQNEGIYKVKFKAGPEVCYTAPISVLSGMTSKRAFLLEGKSYFWIQSQNLVLILQFGPKNTFAKNESAKADYFEGNIYEVTQTFMQEFLRKKRRPFQAQIVKKLNRVIGRWTKFINFQDEMIEFADINLYEIFSINNPLFSDSSNRKDIELLRNEKLEQAQAMKLALEQKQRKDECLRHQYYPD